MNSSQEQYDLSELFLSKIRKKVLQRLSNAPLPRARLAEPVPHSLLCLGKTGHEQCREEPLPCRSRLCDFAEKRGRSWMPGFKEGGDEEKVINTVSSQNVFGRPA